MLPRHRESVCVSVWCVRERDNDHDDDNDDDTRHEKIHLEHFHICNVLRPRSPKSQVPTF